MKAPKYLSRVIIKHSKKCFMKRQANPWSGVILGDGYYGNFTAKKQGHHLWYKVQCNDPDCEAIKAVHSSVLIEA
jgi:hypothetical protein